MAKYLVLWEVVPERMADDPVSIAAGWKVLTNLVKKDMDSGVVKDWGAFPGDRKGYTVIEGTEMDVLKFTMQYVPYITFTTHQALGIDQIAAFLEEMTG